MSGVTPIVFPLFVSTGVLLQFGVSDQFPNYPLLFATSLTFFLATIQLPFLLFTNSTKSLCPILVHFVNNLSFVTIITSFTTLMLAFPNFNEIPHWGTVWASYSGLICFVISTLYKSISKTQPGCRHCLKNVAFLTLCIAFVGLYTDPLLFLPGTIQYGSIIHGMNCLYNFALVPVTFFLGTILVVFSIAPPADPSLPFASVNFKEGMTVLTVAVGLATLIIGGSLTICAALVNFSMAGGFDVGGPGGPNLVEAI